MAEPYLLCDAIKIAYRQSKDGFVVSFAIHPQDMPADLANADIGSQWQMRLVELDDNGNPKEVMSDRAVQARPDETTPVLADPSPVTSARAYHPVAPEKRMTQRAAIMCTQPLFQTWLRQTNSAWAIMNLGTAEQKAAELVRVYCGVPTRKDIVPGSQAARLWDEMLGKFEAWQACLEDIAS